MEVFKTKWCEILDYLLQCPVCLEIKKGMVVQCQTGHHVCESCRDQLDICPLCKRMFLDTRNILAEQLMEQFEKIKLLTLNEPENALNDKPNMITVSTQTDPLVEKKAIDKKENAQIYKATYGLYLCYIGSCMYKSQFGKMTAHIHRFHDDVFYEFNEEQDDGMFSQEWTIVRLTETYNFAFSIQHMGLFFINIRIDGNCRLWSRVLAVFSDTKKFTYRINLLNKLQEQVYVEAEVKSCRIYKDMSRKDFIIKDTNFHMKLPLTCTLIIKKNPTDDKPPKVDDEDEEVI